MNRKSRSGSQQQLRIIGGKWRSRRIAFPDRDGLRPTGDRIRETLFNWLAPDIPAARCLDAFAGSGALGFEALSRGAETVVFVEQDAAAYRHLLDTKALLDAEGATIIQQDLLTWLKAAQPSPFDIIFLDPPFAHGLYDPVFSALEESGAIAAGSLIYIEKALAEEAAPPPNWRCLRDKRAGDVHFRLFIVD
ncbi:MAG: 16S rRNA (guanine(966)-N(2))-methyltransferase RsmD [Porticoccaceae bacterium]